VLQWLRANGYPWAEETCSSAAWQGHLDILQWARANGCPWDEKTCTNAAWDGHLGVLQWAHENGCPWNAEACFFVIPHERVEVLEYLHARTTAQRAHHPFKSIHTSLCSLHIIHMDALARARSCQRERSG